MSARVTIDVQPTPDAAMRAAAERLVDGAARAVSASGRFTIALSGGTTPRNLYALLATPPYATRVPWPAAHVFWGDERCVPPDDPASNYRLAHETLLAHVPVVPEQVHRVRGEDAAFAAAALYERELRAALRTPHGPPTTQPGARLDVMLLGLGDNGHTASLFPYSPALDEREYWVLAVDVDATPPARITLTAPAINAAALVVFVVVGAAKASILRRVLEGPRDPAALPAQLVDPVDGEVCWVVDAAAAAELRRG
jgi:6-phosphogluconolactonase